jgi:hypothetical protein
VAALLAQLLPQLINGLTPQGRVPQSEAEYGAGGMMGLLSQLTGGDAAPVAGGGGIAGMLGALMGGGGGAGAPSGGLGALLSGSTDGGEAQIPPGSPAWAGRRRSTSPIWAGMAAGHCRRSRDRWGESSLTPCAGRTHPPAWPVAGAPKGRARRYQPAALPPDGVAWRGASNMLRSRSMRYPVVFPGLLTGSGDST